jgi:hypothetical protein
MNMQERKNKSGKKPISRDIKKSNSVLNKIKQYHYIFYGILLLFVIVDIFYFRGTSDARIFFIILYWIGVSYVFKLTERHNLITVGCLFSLFAVLYLTFGASPQTERAATLFYLFLLLFVVRQLWGLRHT